MLVALNLSRGFIMTRFRLLRDMFRTILSIVADAEVYTLQECYKILDALYARYPNAYVGMRICPCRQSRTLYDKHDCNITDLTFVFTTEPGKKKRMPYTTFISLDEAKKLLKRFDERGFAHAMFGGCARFIDGSLTVTICNCKKGICIPIDMALKYDTLKYHKPHNIVDFDESKCIGIEKCGKCVEVCQFDARFVNKKGELVYLPDKCLGCGLCANNCPTSANTIRFLHENKIYFYQNLFRKIKQKSKPNY